MQRLLRNISLLILAFAAAFRAEADRTMPTLSTETEEHWYNIVFNNGGYLVADMSNGTEGGLLKTFVNTTNLLNRRNQWKVMASSTDGMYILQSKTGMYMSFSSGRFRASKTSMDMEIHESTLNTDCYEIRPDGVTNKYMNINGGAGVDKELIVYYSDGNTQIRFEEAPQLTDTPFYLHQNLQYIGGTTDGKAIAGGYYVGEDEQDFMQNFQWTFTAVADYSDHYTLQNAAGKYLAFSEAYGFTTTTELDEAYPFAFAVTVATADKTYSYALKTTDDNRFLQLGSDGSLTWTDTEEKIHLVPDTPKPLPRPSTETEDHWYYLNYNPIESQQGYFSENPANNVVRNSQNAELYENIWRVRTVVKGEKTTYYIQSYADRFVQNPNNGTIVTVETQADASGFNLVVDPTGKYFLLQDQGTERYLDNNKGGSNNFFTWNSTSSETSLFNFEPAKLPLAVAQYASTTLNDYQYGLRAGTSAGYALTASYRSNSNSANVGYLWVPERIAGQPGSYRLKELSTGFYFGADLKTATDATDAQVFTLSPTRNASGRRTFALSRLTSESTLEYLSLDAMETLVWQADASKAFLLTDNLPYYPAFSTATETYWYYLKFVGSTSYVSDRRVKTDDDYIVNYKANETDNLGWSCNLWKIERSPNTAADGTPRYRLVNYSGRYVGFTGNKDVSGEAAFKSVTSAAEAVDFEIERTADNLLLKLANGTMYLANNGGGHATRLATGTTQDNCLLAFIGSAPLTGDIEGTPSYYTFSGHGAFALHDSGDGQPLTAQEKAAADDDAPYQWLMVATEQPGGYHLKSLAGRYASWTEANGFTMTTDQSAAYVFTLDNNYYDRSWSFHYALRSTDGSEYLTLPDAATGTLTWTTEKTRFNVVRQSETLAGTAFPELLQHGYSVPYYLRFQNADRLMANNTYADGSGGLRLQVLSNKAPIQLHRRAQAWIFEAAPGDLGDFYLYDYESHRYLSFDETSFSWTIVNDKSQAVPLRFFTDHRTPDLYQLSPADALYCSAMTTANATLNEPGLEGYSLKLGIRLVNAASDVARIKPEDYRNYTVRHKRSWFVKQASDAIDNGDDSYIPIGGFVLADEDKSYGWTSNSYTGSKLQNTNTFRVTRYIKPGDTRKFIVPNASVVSSGGTREKAYQRWFDYRTDGPIDSTYVFFEDQSKRLYSNGLVLGYSLPFNGKTSGDHVEKELEFYLPFNAPDDFEYTVALDASTYNDFVDYFGENGNPIYPATQIDNTIEVPAEADMIEPSLTSRYIYTMRNARQMADRLTACTYGSDQWLEKHTIHFPAKFVSFKDPTIPLDYELKNYWFYTDEAHTTEGLANITRYKDICFSIDAAGTGTNPAGIIGFTSSDWPIDGAKTIDGDISYRRFINFKYPGDPTETQTTSIVLGDSCVICVYARPNGVAGDDILTSLSKGPLYQLCRYVIYFDKDCEPRPHNEVIGIVDGDISKPISNRSPEALYVQTKQSSVADITFDKHSNAYASFFTPPKGKSSVLQTHNGVNANTNYELVYRYPLLFENSSYSFQPLEGSNVSGDSYVVENPPGTYTIARRIRFDWGTAGQANVHPMSYYYKKAYAGTSLEPTFTPETDGFLYIDCSELPGKICNLDYSGELCNGSRLIFSAWISSMNDYRPTNPTASEPANVIFQVNGYTAEGKEIPLYTFSPGPIFEQARKMDGTKVDPAKGDDNIWQQVYFTFVNNSSEHIVHYSLSVDNACTSTFGGDILIDDIEMYALKPTVQISHSTPVCGQELTLTKLETDFDALMSALGIEENHVPEGGYPKLWFCMLDKEIFDNKMSEANSLSTDAIKNAFNAALVGDPVATDYEQAAFRSITIPTYYTALPEFSLKKALEADGKAGLVMREQKGKIRNVVISDQINAENLKASHPYYIVFVPRYGNDPIIAEYASDQFQMGTSCCIQSEFRTTNAIQIIEDGSNGEETEQNTVRVCAGSNVNLSVHMQGVDEGTGNTVPMITHYDWWIDFVGGDFSEIYIDSDGRKHLWNALSPDEATPEGYVSLREALMNFRHFYPTAISMADVEPQGSSNDVYCLTEAMIKGLATLTQMQPAGTDDNGNATPATIAPLVLRCSTLNIDIPSNAVGEEGRSTQKLTVVPFEEPQEGFIFCFEPQTLKLIVDGHAPTVFTGLESVSEPDLYPYPEHLTNIPIRTTLALINQVKKTDDNLATPPAYKLHIPLRNVKTVHPGSKLSVNQVTDAAGVEYMPIYLVGTNDPDCRIFDVNSDGTTAFREIGRVTDYQVVEDLSGVNDPNYIEGYFYRDLQLREGYIYTLRVNVHETITIEDQGISQPCDGAIVFDMKVIPAHLKWTGAANNTDWTNDLNWARADRDELYYGEDYLTNADNETMNGFVPHATSQVLLATGTASYPELYSLSKSTNGFLDGLNEATSTPDIRYDMVMSHNANGSIYDCLEFSTYQADGIVLQSGTELLHSELLNYNRAWMEYALSPNRWYTLGSPFKEMFAGDWYAPTADGRQQTAYYHDVLFDPKAGYDRYSPAVYQRSWDKAGEAKLFYLEIYPNLPTAPATSPSEDVAIAADWSSVYNDVLESYAAGGFSLKANSVGSKATYTDFRFRLPKEDTNYSYYLNNGSSEGGDNQTVDRLDPTDKQLNLTNRFLTDNFSENGESLPNASFEITVKNGAAGNRYFLASNPFPCGIDMQQFFTENASIIDAKYWLVTAQGQTAVMKDETTGWITVNTDSEASNRVLAPGQGFFVKASAANPTGTLTLRFTPEMEASAVTAKAILRSPSRTAVGTTCPTLRMKIEQGAQSTEAVIVKDSESKSDYQSAEDLELFFDQNLKDLPTVYSLAGTQATSVNRRPSMYRTPVGILGTGTDSLARVTFSGLKEFSETLSLLDNLTGEVQPLTLAADANGEVSIDLPSRTTGRYFILSSEQPAPEEIAADGRPLVEVDGDHVTVSSTAAFPLRRVHIVDAEGRTLYLMQPFTPSISVRLPLGAYVIDAATERCNSQTKITVK